MNGDEFRSGTLLHGLCLAACGLIVGLYVGLAKSRKGSLRRHSLQKFTGIGCLLAWFLNTAYWAMPSRFMWEQALPLHYCNMANLIGAVAVLWRRRLFQGVIYFWALALCIWAFITPTVRYGPAHMDFWIFWIYHLFILLAVAHVMVIDQFRPSFRDLLRVSAFTSLYTIMLVIVDYAFGWNYGFVGPSKPKSPTLIDSLGVYPLRLVWITLLAALLFVLAFLPWHWRARKIRPSG